MTQAIAECVHIVEDEDGVRSTMAAIVRAAGFGAREYATAEDFLSALEDLAPGCIVTDVRMPGMDGLEMVERLKARGIGLPVIVISGNADIALAVGAMRAGARNFLEKPLHAAALQDAVREVIFAPPEKKVTNEAHARTFQTLTRRQHQVLLGIMEGHQSKLIAHNLGLSVRTVEGYRAEIMMRTKARSLSELIKMAVEAGI